MKFKKRKNRQKKRFKNSIRRRHEKYYTNGLTKLLESVRESSTVKKV